eukprot:3126381-Prymnesium_polylepis.1
MPPPCSHAAALLTCRLAQSTPPRTHQALHSHATPMQHPPRHTAHCSHIPRALNPPHPAHTLRARAPNAPHPLNPPHPAHTLWARAQNAPHALNPPHPAHTLRARAQNAPHALHPRLRRLQD